MSPLPRACRLSLVMLPLLLGCSNKESAQDASTTSTPLGLSCSEAFMGCACVPATMAPPDGSTPYPCSKSSLGGAAVCCQKTDDAGVVNSCYCAKHGTCQQLNMTTCLCSSSTPNPEAGPVMPTCNKPATGRCCKKVPDGSIQAECRCSGANQCAMDEMELLTCTPNDTALVCPMGTTPVESCN